MSIRKNKKRILRNLSKTVVADFKWIGLDEETANCMRPLLTKSLKTRERLVEALREYTKAPVQEIELV